MDDSLYSKMRVKIFLLVFVGVIVGIVGVLGFQYLKGPKQTVSIVGTGEIEAPADSVSLYVNITNSSWSQKQAESDNKIAVDKLKKELLVLGIPESRITQSSYVDLYAPSAPDMMISSGPSEVTSSNPRSVTDLTIELDSIKNIEKVYRVISLSPEAKLSSTSYFLKKRTGFESKARELALEDARHQVEAIAKINKQRVGKLVSIQSTGIREPQPIYEKGGMMFPAQTDTQSIDESTISYTEQSIKVTTSYNVQYELK